MLRCIHKLILDLLTLYIKTYIRLILGLFVYDLLDSHWTHSGLTTTKTLPGHVVSLEEVQLEETEMVLETVPETVLDLDVEPKPKRARRTTKKPPAAGAWDPPKNTQVLCMVL